MKYLISKLLSSPWKYRQPLTRRPSFEGATASDLFIWRKDGCWSTYFELTNVPALFDRVGPKILPSSKSSGEKDFGEASRSQLVIFNSSGFEILRKDFIAPSYSRTKIHVSDLIEDIKDNFGTFCILHSINPDAIKNINGHISERGYVGYQYSKGPLLSYSHGNYDAVCFDRCGALERIGGFGFLKRKYSLQHELSSDGVYEVGLVNPTLKPQKFNLTITKTKMTEKIINGMEAIVCWGGDRRSTIIDVVLSPGASHIVELPSHLLPGRLSVQSRLIMGRPIMFHRNSSRVNVFHG